MDEVKYYRTYPKERVLQPLQCYVGILDGFQNNLRIHVLNQ